MSPRHFLNKSLLDFVFRDTISLEEKQFRQISETLDKIRLLLGQVSVKGLEDKEQLTILSRAGFSAKEISVITGKNTDAVNKALQRMRKSVE